VDQAVAARVRAQGDAFDAEQYRSALAEKADVAYIRSEIEAHEKAARSLFQAGRQVRPEKRARVVTRPETPAAAYQA
jgi:hypothetical protein